MGKTDVYESDYLENPEIFADLVNGVLYHGEQIVKPQELSEQDGELRSISGSNVKKTIRDKARLWNGTMFAVLAVENQKENVTSDEFLSGMRKEDRFIPVITIVVYYGKEKPWDGARTLFRLLDMKGKEQQIMPYISDYHLNLFDFHEYDNFEQFHSELKPFFEFLRYSGEKNLLKEKMEAKKEQYEELSSQAKVLLTRLTNIKEIPDVEAEKFEKGEFSVYKAFEDMKEEGKAERLIEQICKKLQKNKSTEVIADELEEELPVVENIIKIQRQLGSYDVEQIYREMETERIEERSAETFRYV